MTTKALKSVFPLFLLMFGIGCSDIAEVAPNEKEHPRGFEKKPQRVRYPKTMSLTDTQGRVINVSVLGKRGNEITFEKGNDVFALPLARLVEKDQIRLNRFADGGRFTTVKRRYELNKKYAQRQARWHRQPADADKEAKETGLPTLIVMLVHGNAESASIENALAKSREFKAWAGKNLVLCMFSVDDPRSKKTSGATERQNRFVAEGYGIIHFDIPVALFKHSGKTEFYPIRDLQDGDSAIKNLSSYINLTVSYQ